MYGNSSKDQRGEKKHEPEIRSEWQDHSVSSNTNQSEIGTSNRSCETLVEKRRIGPFSELLIYSIAHKDGSHDHGFEYRKDFLSRRPPYYELGDEVKTGLISDDEFSHYSFPTIGFCDINTKNEVSPKQAQISDLCKEDRQKIAQLVTEISRCREEQKEKSLQTKKLFDENLELKLNIGRLEKDLAGLRTSVNYGEENLRLLSKTHAIKESSLKNQNLELQSKIKLLENDKIEIQQKLEEAQKQTEKLANVVYYVANENKKFYKKYENSKEKLKSALEIITQLEVSLKECKSKPVETKSSQTNLEGIRPSRSKLSNCKREHKSCQKYSWNQEQDERGSSDEDSLISELFFIPKQKNHTKTKYFSDDES